MTDLTAKLSRTDEALLRAVAAMVKMTPAEFLGFAGASLVDALTGLKTAMERSSDLRRQVQDLIEMHLAGTITEAELAAMLQEIGDMAGDYDAIMWTPEA